jgi:ribonucleoside-diphosphate reductase alpha chain
MNSLLQKCFIKYELNQSEVEERVRQKGVLADDEIIPGILKDLFKTSLQIPFEYHMKHQIAFQRYTDNAVSKTINLPANATKEDVDMIYREAWQKGLKGITIYRYGSKEIQVLYQGSENKENVSVQSQGCKICIG